MKHEDFLVRSLIIEEMIAIDPLEALGLIADMREESLDAWQSDSLSILSGKANKAIYGE